MTENERKQFICVLMLFLFRKSIVAALFLYTSYEVPEARFTMENKMKMSTSGARSNIN